MPMPAPEMHPTPSSPMKPTAAPLPPLLQAKPKLFGSAARGEFDPAHSDLDFIVHMKNRRDSGYARRFYEFAEAIEAPVGSRVDLLTELMSKNPTFKAEVDQDRRVLEAS